MVLTSYELEGTHQNCCNNCLWKEYGILVLLVTFHSSKNYHKFLL